MQRVLPVRPHYLTSRRSQPTAVAPRRTCTPHVGHRALLTHCTHACSFPWLIWALSTLPVLLSLGHLLRPRLIRRGSAALAAVLAVLQMIAADTFHNVAHSRLADAISKVEHGNLICVAGFAILAAMSLLMILLESFLGDRHLEERNERKATEAERVGTAGGQVGMREPVAKV